MSSGYLLAPLPVSLEPELPMLPNSSYQSLDSTPSTPTTLLSANTIGIPKSNVYIFTAGLYKRTKLATPPSSVLYTCM
jgi:hypothetical protein